MKQAGRKLWNMIETVAVFFLKVIFHVLHKELTEERIETFLQFIRFGFVGLSNTVISYVLYAASLLLLQKNHWLPQIDYLTAQAIAFVLSVLWSFYWNNKMVFQVKEGERRCIWKTLLKTYVSYSFTGLFLNSVLLVLWVQVFHISEYIGPIINLVISVPVNFLINKFWAFRG